MSSTITVSCGNQKRSYNVNLSSANASKVFSHYDMKSKGPQKQLFNFSQKEYKTNDMNLFNKICAALNKLMSLGGNKNIIDDDDFKKAPTNSAECKDNVWHNDDAEDVNAMDYHTNSSFFHIG